MITQVSSACESLTVVRAGAREIQTGPLPLIAVRRSSEGGPDRPRIMEDWRPAARPGISGIALDMGKRKKNADIPNYVPRAPQTAQAFIGNGEKKFEDLSRDLMAEEPGISDARLYGRPRQKQYGIDVYAERTDESGIEVASCKCYQEVRKGQITTWSDDFLDHWETHWKALGVRRFVLCVACDLNSHERRDEIERQKVRFNRHGVKYEVWTAAKLTRLLRKHTDIRDVYFRRQFDASASAGLSAQVTAGPGPQGGGGGSTSFLTAAMVSQLAEMQKLVSQAVSGRLDDLRLALQTGRYEGIETALAGIVADEKGWANLEAAVQARVLRMQAMLLINMEKMAEALKIIDRAEALAPDEERRTRAVWVARTEGAAAAIPILGTPKTQDGALLRVGLLIETEKLPEAQQALASDPLITDRDAEWHRLSACAAFYAGDRPAALQYCEQAEALAPNNVAVLETGAVTRYGLALSPAANFRFSDGPDASQVDFGLLDEASQAHLRKALELFDRLGERAVTRSQKHRVGMWRLACLALIPERAKELKAECLRLITGRPPAGIAAVWALARGIDFDQEAADHAFRAELGQTPPPMDALQALIMMRLIRGEREQALEVLRQYEPRFTDLGAEHQLKALRRRITRRRGRPGPDDEVGPFDELLSLVKAKWTGLQARAVDEFLAQSTLGANVVLVGCLILASHNEWRHIVPHIGRLLGEVGNGESVRLSTYARYNTGDYAGALAILEQAAEKFPGGKLPPDLLRLQALSAGHEGKFARALPLAHELADRTGRPGDQILYSELAVRSGSIAEAIPFIRQLHESGAVPLERLMAFIPSVATVDPALARSLLTRVTASDTILEAGGALLDWHYRLGMEEEAHALLERLLALQPQGKNRPFRSVPISEIGEFIRERQKLHVELNVRLRQDGAPIHVVAGMLNANLADVWEQSFCDREVVLLIRSANRPDIPHFDVTPRVLALDITAVLSIEQLGLLDTLLDSSLELELPASMMELINELEQRLPHQQPSRLATLQNVADAATDGKLKVWTETTALPVKTMRVAFEAGVAEKQPGDKHRGGSHAGGNPGGGNQASSSQRAGGQKLKDGSAATARSTQPAPVKHGPVSGDPAKAQDNSAQDGPPPEVRPADARLPDDRPIEGRAPGGPAEVSACQDQTLESASGTSARPEAVPETSGTHVGGADDQQLSDQPSDQQPLIPGAVTADSLPTVTLSALGEELVRTERVSAEELARVRIPLTGGAIQAGAGGESVIEHSQALLFQGNTVDSVFTAHLDEQAAQRWELWVEGEHLRAVRAELKASREARALAERIKHLRERLAKAIRDNRVRVLPVRFDDTGKKPEAPHDLLKPLSELLTLPKSEDRWIWIDDRYCTGYGGANLTPIVTSFEVLTLLEQLKLIDTGRRYELLLKLRRANALSLPISTEELMYWLMRASDRDGELVESEALQTLRRSFNMFAALIKDLRTQPGPHDQGRVLELRGIVDALSLLREALNAVWSRDEDPLALRVARSEWLWGAVRLEVPLQADAAQRTRSLDLWRRTVSHLVMLGTTLTWQSEEGSAVNAYFDWLTSHLPGLKDASDDPPLTDQVIADLRQIFAYDAGEGAEKLAEQGLDPPRVRALLGKVVEGLPPAIRNGLHADSELMRNLGARMTQVITINGLQVEPVPFFAALEEAARGQPTTVKTATGQEFTVEAALPRFTLRGASTITLAAPEFELLSPELAPRLAFLRSPDGNLDWQEPDDTPAIETWASMSIAWDRVRSWAAQRDAAQVARFRRLSEMLRGGEQVTVAELRPSTPAGYQTYLALVLHDSQIDWAASATAAIERFGFSEAATRWAGLPVRLPEPFHGAYAALRPEERAALQARALAPTASASFPARILEFSARVGKSESQVQKDTLAHILANWTEIANGQLAVLEWAGRMFKRDPEWRGAPTALRLASTWVHAERTVGVLLESGLSRAQLSGFESLTLDGVTGTMILEPQIEEDVSAPRRLTNRILLAYVLSASVAGAKEGDPLASHREEILSRLVIEGPRGKSPAPDLFQDRSPGRDALGGYLGQELDQRLSAALPIQELQVGTAAGREMMREQTLLYVEQQRLDIVAWAQLYSVGHEWLPEAARRRIETTVQSTVPSKSNPEGVRTLLMGLAKVAPFLGESVRKRLAENVMPWVFALAQKYGSLVISDDESTDIHKDATAVTEFVFGLARRATREECYKALSELIPAYVRQWPALGMFCRGLVQLALDEGTTRENQALWDAHVATQRVR